MFTDCYRFFGLSWETSTFNNYHPEDSKHSGRLQHKHVNMDSSLLYSAFTLLDSTRLDSTPTFTVLVSTPLHFASLTRAELWGFEVWTKRNEAVRVFWVVVLEGRKSPEEVRQIGWTRNRFIESMELETKKLLREYRYTSTPVLLH